MSPGCGRRRPPHAAAAVSIQTRNLQHMPCSDNLFHHPSVNYAQLPCPLTLWKMWYMTCGFLFIYRFPYEAHTVRKYVLTLARKIALLFWRGLGEKGLCFKVQTQLFSDYLHVYDIFSMWQQCLEYKKTPCHFICYKFSCLKVLTKNGSNGLPVK